MTRQIIPTDQELINWVEKSGMNIVRTDDAIRVRNIALKEINGMNKEFVIKEKSDLQFIQTKFNLQEWIPYFSFAMGRILNSESRKNLLLFQITKTGKYITFYGEQINQSVEDFKEQFEEAEKICEGKEILAVLDPAEIDQENLGKKAKYLIDNNHKICVIQYRDCIKYIRGWEALRIFGNKLYWIVVDVTPKQTKTAEKYSNLLAPLFFSENISVSHARGRGFGGGKPPITWLNEHFSYEKNSELGKNILKTKLLANSRIYNINKAITLVNEKLQIPKLTSLSNNIKGIGYFAEQIRLANVG